jgi:tetratricopeptide (TPR) repeat protein
LFKNHINIKRQRNRIPVRAKQLIVILLLGMVVINGYAQSAKEHYKQGLEAQKKSNFKEATKSFTSAINLKSDYTEAYFERANCNFNLKQFENALSDYIYLHRKSPLNENYIIKAALSYIELKRWAEAQTMFMKLESDEINLHIAEAKVKMALCKIMLRNFEEAVQYLSESLSIFADDDQIYFYKGIASDSLNDYQTAVICYTKSIEIIKQKLVKKSISTRNCDSLKCIYVVRLGNTQLSMFDYVSAKESYTQAIKLNPKRAELYLTRANICLQSNELNEALADLEICATLNLKTYSYYYTKARVLKKAGQFNLAIETLSQIVKKDTAFHAILLKGQCLESIGNFMEAQITYKEANKNVPLDKKKEMEAALKRIRNRVYELNRETDPPFFSIASPSLDLDKKIMVPKSYQFVEIKGKVNDKSLIKSILVNDLEADFERDSLNPEFRIKVNLFEKQYLKVKIVDVYSNITEQNFEFNRSEKNAPTHKLFLAYDEKAKEIYFDKSNEHSLLVSGRVDDESNIKRIMINNKTASFNIHESNPIFEVKIDVTHLDSINILIIDEYDNVSLSTYFINSKKAIAMAQNPMGKTWLIFIANSSYENFSTLAGPDKDLNQIRNAILQYQFDNIITKRNMTLSEMEKFFRIELRNLVKEQGVNSIMIWFAGHGKYTNETGYWLPVNAKKDDELSYYPIPYLRSNLTSYGKLLRNILIVSDACESGPSFSLTDEKVVDFECKFLASGNSNSAYVFSSTTNEKASDNSVFCETFADVLNSSTEECVPMSKIVKSVSAVVEKRQSQRCKYGKIKDIEINNSNFYFLKRAK